MYDKRIKSILLILVMIFAMSTCILVEAMEVTTYSGWQWSNNRSPLGTEGDKVYLKNKVQVAYSVGGNPNIHYIQGTASLVKNLVDPYCYVRISGEWYVHLAGIRTDNGYSTTGWYKESDVISSAGLDEISGYMIYKNVGTTTAGVTVVGDITSSSYTTNSSGFIAHTTKGLNYHSVESGSSLGSGGLYNASSFGLTKKGYEVTAWANVDKNGKVYGTYNFTANYNIDDFISSEGVPLKDSEEGSYIYLVPVWLYTNESPEIKAEDIYIFASSDWDEGRLLEEVSVWDKEDGDITDDLYIVNKEELRQSLVDFALEEVEDVRRMELIVEVKDSLGEVTRLVIDVFVYGIESIKDDYGYVRYISDTYMESFSSESIWNELSRKSFLLNIFSGT